LFDIALTCFTALRSRDVSDTTRQMCRVNFIFDFLACVPGLLTGEEVLWLYPFKVLRMIRILRIVTFLDKLSGLLKDRFM
jgi:hypothetical protein